MMMECESRKSAGWAMQVAATRHDTRSWAASFISLSRPGYTVVCMHVFNTYLGGSGGEMVKVGKTREAWFLC
jgi:hypothetical protein